MPETDAEIAASLIAPLRARAEAYSSATARVTAQAAPALLHAIGFRPFRRLLDLACGPGFVAGAARALGATARGVDISTDMVAVARSRHPGVSFAIGDAHALSEPSGRYDFVACNFGMPHFDDPDRVLAEAWRVCAPGGVFGFTQWRGPEASPFFSAVAAGLAAADPAAGVAPPDPTTFHLSETDAIERALSAAGFEAVATRTVDLVYDGPDGDFLAILDDLALPMAVPREPSPALDAARDALNSAMAPFRGGGRYRIPMPAALAVGRKPSAATDPR